MSLYDAADRAQLEAISEGTIRAHALSTAVSIGLNRGFNADELLEAATKIHDWLAREFVPSGADYLLPLSVDKCRDLVVLLDTALTTGQHTGRSAKTAREVIGLLAEHAV